MSKIAEFNELQADRDALKNIADFFYESINNFKRNLSEISVSINNLLRSFTYIERQLGNQGYDYPENSSEILFERLTKNKQIREKEQKEFIKKLIQRPTPSQFSPPPTPNLSPLPKIRPPPKPGVPPERVVPQHSPELKAEPKPKPELTIKKVEFPDEEKPPTTNLEKIKVEMLATLKRLKKQMKGG